MRVLVTGHRGYVGSVMVGVLRHARFDVVGLDCDFYQGCDFGRVHESVPSFDIDLRDVEFTDLLSFDAVVHLAALPEDRSSELDPTTIREINEEVTIRLAECCKQASVSRFLFSSSCDVYGRSGGDLLDEHAPVIPAMLYAAAKYRCECALASLADHTFTPIILRHAGAYGVSPRMRIDLIVNDFVASAVANGRIVVGSGGRTWRPLIHVEDIARAYAAVLLAPDDLVHNQVFNLVADESASGGRRVIDIADMVTELVSDCTRSIRQDAFDEPSYRVDGSKFQLAFPKFSFRWTLPLGIRQLRNAMLSAGLTPGDWRSDRYRRVLRLKALMERGDLSRTLRCVCPTLR